MNTDYRAAIGPNNKSPLKYLWNAGVALPYLVCHIYDRARCNGLDCEIAIIIIMPRGKCHELNRRTRYFSLCTAETSALGLTHQVKKSRILDVTCNCCEAVARQLSTLASSDCILNIFISPWMLLDITQFILHASFFKINLC